MFTRSTTSPLNCGIARRPLTREPSKPFAVADANTKRIPMFNFRRPGSRHHCGWQLFAKVWYIWSPLEVAAGPATILNDRRFVPMSVNECVSESVLFQGLSVEMLLCTLRCVAKDCVLICCWSEVLVPSQRLTGQADFIAKPHHNERLKNGGVVFPPLLSATRSDYPTGRDV